MSGTTATPHPSILQPTPTSTAIRSPPPALPQRPPRALTASPVGGPLGTHLHPRPGRRCGGARGASPAPGARSRSRRRGGSGRRRGARGSRRRGTGGRRCGAAREEPGGPAGDPRGAAPRGRSGSAAAAGSGTLRGEAALSGAGPGSGAPPAPPPPPGLTAERPAGAGQAVAGGAAAGEDEEAAVEGVAAVIQRRVELQQEGAGLLAAGAAQVAEARQPVLAQPGRPAAHFAGEVGAAQPPRVLRAGLRREAQLRAARHRRGRAERTSAPPNGRPTAARQRLRPAASAQRAPSGPARHRNGVKPAAPRKGLTPRAASRTQAAGKAFVWMLVLMRSRRCPPLQLRQGKL